MRQMAMVLVYVVLLTDTASAITMEQWTTFDHPYQQVYVLGVLDAWMNLEQTRVEGAQAAGPKRCTWKDQGHARHPVTAVIEGYGLPCVQ